MQSSSSASAGSEPEPTPSELDAPRSVIEARYQNAAHGPVDPFTTWDELKGKLHGRWYACDRGAAKGFYAREAGIEFRSSDSWNFIHENDDGTLVTLRGIDNEGDGRRARCATLIRS